ncbi:MAG: DUF4368 domain-containing protein, partial [Eubacteriales bacterium]|nr:DUF4368 domain-containing protein [Eubacteriales bacterium]
VVHAPEKIDGKRFQKVDIVFNFVGEIHLPTDPQTEHGTESDERTGKDGIALVMGLRRLIENYFLMNDRKPFSL